jgi:hypothetical protein
LTVTYIGENERNSYKILFGKVKGKRALGRTRHRWEDTRETGCEDDEWLCSVKLIGCLFFTMCYVGLLSFAKIIGPR